MPEFKHDKIIQRLALGLDFVDVGGLWNTRNERVSVALKAGAKSGTMIDIQKAGNKWWNLFDERMREFDLPDYEKIVADATAPDFPSIAGQYDFVNCAGVIYHVPSPYYLLYNLRAISRRYVMVTGVIVPDVIENEEGRIELGGGASLLCPALNEQQRKVVRKHFEDFGIKTRAITEVQPYDLIRDDGSAVYGPWWFLMTADFMIELGKTLRLKCLEYGPTFGGAGTGVLFERDD